VWWSRSWRGIKCTLTPTLSGAPALPESWSVGLGLDDFESPSPDTSFLTCTTFLKALRMCVHVRARVQIYKRQTLTCASCHSTPNCVCVRERVCLHCVFIPPFPPLPAGVQPRRAHLWCVCWLVPHWSLITKSWLMQYGWLFLRGGYGEARGCIILSGWWRRSCGCHLKCTPFHN
jgi:hypothetical protein